SFVLGAAILFNTPYVKVPWATIITLAIATGSFFAFAIAKAVQARMKPSVTGGEALIGAVAVVRTPLRPTGSVFLQGEWWDAVAEDGPVDAGERVQVVGREGFRLHVRRLASDHKSPQQQ
ncbi:MAG TPA: nodulation protein NfeD, partial [Anaerolineae bacterium]|nr:nodulation protein NfeD [Anaerolineae bacterium]